MRAFFVQRRSSRGQALAETALMFFILVLVVFGSLVALQWVLTDYTVTQAARAAVHQAALVGGYDGERGSVEQTARTALDTSLTTRSEHADIQVTCADPCRRYSAITVDIQYVDEPWIAIGPFQQIRAHARITRAAEQDGPGTGGVSVELPPLPTQLPPLPTAPPAPTNPPPPTATRVALPPQTPPSPTTPAAPTNPPQPSSTRVPPTLTRTAAPSTATPCGPSENAALPDRRAVPGLAVLIVTPCPGAPTFTPRPTWTPLPPTATAVPPTNTLPPTATAVPPTNTTAPTATRLPPTATYVPTLTPFPPTATFVPSTPIPTFDTSNCTPVQGPPYFICMDTPTPTPWPTFTLPPGCEYIIGAPYVVCHDPSPTPTRRP